MLTLAHLSDPHLAPLPEPRWGELIGKRVTGYINWRRRRQFIHDPAVLSAIASDIRAQAPDHIAVAGSAVPPQVVAAGEAPEDIDDAGFPDDLIVTTRTRPNCHRLPPVSALVRSGHAFSLPPTCFPYGPQSAMRHDPIGL